MTHLEDTLKVLKNKFLLGRPSFRESKTIIYPEYEAIKIFIITQHIRFLEAGVERLDKLMFTEDEPEDTDEYMKGFNQALQDQITHYTRLIASSRELLTK